MPGLIDQFTDNTPLGWWSQPVEIAALVALLVSDEASLITGTLQLVDGGTHLMRYPDIFAPPSPGEPPQGGSPMTARPPAPPAYDINAPAIRPGRQQRAADVTQRRCSGHDERTPP